MPLYPTLNPFKGKDRRGGSVYQLLKFACFCCCFFNLKKKIAIALISFDFAGSHTFEVIIECLSTNLVINLHIMVRSFS